MARSTLLVIFILLMQFTSIGLSVTLCGPKNVLEIELGKSNNTFTCEGLQSNESVKWSFIEPGIVTELVLGVCHPFYSNGETCNSNTPDVFYLQRTLDTSSDVIVNALTTSNIERFGNGMIKCEVLLNNETRSNVACPVDYIIPAEGVTCNVSFRSNTWTLFGQCKISAAYSSLRRYNCQWFQKENTQNEQLILRTSNITYNISNSSRNITGFCFLNTSLPIANGAYTFTVGITPGNRNFTSTFTGDNTIYKPSVSPTISCTGESGQYAKEGADLVCICAAPNLGQPPGRLLFHWHTNKVIYGNYSENRVFLIMNVTRQDNRKIIHCVLEWATRSDLSVNFTLVVAYGPDNISIKAPLDFDIHPTTPNALTIICNSSEAYPNVTYQWTGRCSRETGSICAFYPSPGDNRVNITCIVSNSILNITLKATHLLKLNYPPADPPVIVDYSGEPLYSGQSKKISCTVNGGNPLVRNVTLNCQGQSQTDEGQNSSITLTLNSSHNGINCTCRSFWKIPYWYTSFAKVTLLVYCKPFCYSDGKDM